MKTKVITKPEKEVIGVEKLSTLRKMYKDGINNKLPFITFYGRSIHLGYMKYLLEYLEGLTALESQIQVDDLCVITIKLKE